MNNSLFQKIAFLYPKEKDKVYQEIVNILNRFKKEFNFKKKSDFSFKRFSEKDIVLICYPDHISTTQENLKRKKIKILHKFLKKYAFGLVNKIHLLPFFPYSSDEGFSVIDYYQVREDLGDWEDIKALSMDFELIFDFVVNHISSKSRWFEKFLAGDDQFYNYFIVFDKKIDTSFVYRPRNHPLLTPFFLKGKKLFVWTTFSPDQIDLNYKNPKVFLEMIKILLFYVAQKVKVIRLDAVRYLWKKLKTSCVDLPQTHMIIKIFREILDEVAPDVLLLSEIKGSLDIAYSYFGESDESDLIYNFQLSPLILISFLKEDVKILSSFLKNLKSPPSKKNTYLNITATHDGIGLTPLVGFMKEKEINWLVKIIKNRGGLVNYHLVRNQLKPYELNITYLDALGAVEPFLASQAILLSLMGIPAIYFNSFIGGQNWYEGVKKTRENRSINRERFDYQKLIKELKNRKSVKHKVYYQYKKLLQTRINEPLFSPLSGQEIIDFHPKIFTVLRLSKREKILCLVNISSKEVEVDLKKIRKILEKNVFFDLLTKEKIDCQMGNILRMKPYQVFWLK